MKKLLQYFMVASIFAACNSKSDLDTNKSVVLSDSAMYNNNIMTDTGSVIETSLVTPTNENTAVANKPVTKTKVTESNTNTNTSTAKTTTVAKKKGWSKAAKDATIGGIGGAITGAIVSKHKVKGAVIGGVLGAAGGYIFGRSKDKKDGR